MKKVLLLMSVSAVIVLLFAPVASAQHVYDRQPYCHCYRQSRCHSYCYR
jgi:hypothetical protein